MDGFLIELVWDDEEPLFVSREEEVEMPDYSGASAKCCICGSSFRDILDSVQHVHRLHGVLGGSRLIMLGEFGVSRCSTVQSDNSLLTDADRMLQAGFICLTG